MNLIVELIPSHIKENMLAYYLEVLVTISMSIILFAIAQIEKIANLKCFPI
jgi:hypothetical protein